MQYNAGGNSIPPSGTGAGGVTQLEFNQAMSDFKHMFPDMEEDVIEAVLRANSGVVDATIDQLLQINNDSLKKKAAMALNNQNLYKSNMFVDGPSSSSGIGTIGGENENSMCGKSYKKELSFPKSPIMPLMAPDLRSISKDSLRYQRRWNPPLLGELPSDFLRIILNDTQRKINNHHHHHQAQPQQHANIISSTFLQQKMEENKRNRQMTAMSDDPEMAQYLEDERFAILLQNEEFVRELRMNQDFMSTLESDISGSSDIRFYGSGTGEGSGTAGAASNFLDSDAAFKERLRNMGKVSKKKFTQLARLFSGRMRKNFKQLDNGNNSSGTGSGSREQQQSYFYQDLSNDNYEDTAIGTEGNPSSSETLQQRKHPPPM